MIAKLVSTFLLVSSTFIFLTFFSFNILQEAHGINETQQKNNNDTVNFEKLVAQYLNWWINVPIEEDPQQVDNPCVIHNTDSIIFLHDPFEMGEIKNTCTIPHKSLFFPFYIGWCDNGNQGYYRTESYNKLLECTLDANRGLVTMNAYLDDKKIVDVRLTNKTQFHNYEKPQDFESSPAKYKAVAYCFCGFIDKNQITPGNHQLSYYTKIEGSGGLDKTKGWDHESKITYILTVE